jgi:hypothetical protein
MKRIQLTPEQAVPLVGHESSMPFQKPLDRYANLRAQQHLQSAKFSIQHRHRPDNSSYHTTLQRSIDFVQDRMNVLQLPEPSGR